MESSLVPVSPASGDFYWAPFPHLVDVGRWWQGPGPGPQGVHLIGHCEIFKRQTSGMIAHHIPQKYITEIPLGLLLCSSSLVFPSTLVSWPSRQGQRLKLPYLLRYQFIISALGYLTRKKKKSFSIKAINFADVLKKNINYEVWHCIWPKARVKDRVFILSLSPSLRLRLPPHPLPCVQFLPCKSVFSCEFHHALRGS